MDEREKIEFYDAVHRDLMKQRELLPIQRIGPQMVRDLAALVALCASVAITSAFVGWAIAAWRAAL